MFMCMLYEFLFKDREQAKCLCECYMSLCLKDREQVKCLCECYMSFCLEDAEQGNVYVNVT
jgi:hypothetical protein